MWYEVEIESQTEYKDIVVKVVENVIVKNIYKNQHETKNIYTGRADTRITKTKSR